MAISTFIPELWSARLLNALDKVHVAASLVNRDYEGEIKQCGSAVHINSIGNITVSDYEADSEIGDPESLSVSDSMLEIDNAKYFNFQIDDVEQAQAAGNIMDKAMERSAYALNDAADAYILETLVNGADDANVIGSDTPIALTADNVYGYIVQLRLILDKNNVPHEGRSIVLPPDVYALLLQDSRFTGSGNMGEETTRSGFIGRIAGFDIYESNNCYSDGECYKVTAQVPSACTYAEQVLETTAYRPEKRFADAVKGLHVYGAKVTDPTAIAVLVCTVA
ncbi:MAG: P22 coat protein - protein 5 domain protein [Oscillospiraceae bacterium]|nr:P22 coat protein - protein 5 domain protein [Oscillospiraceae bacterium]MCD7805245.1 P22 coat protein - protein 5 domain protein [Oscillospiraceae bacterium]